MNTLSTVSPTAVLALNVRFTNDAMIVALSDGREVSVPLEWFPLVAAARRAKQEIAQGLAQPMDYDQL